jgi:hypothetical protein
MIILKSHTFNKAEDIAKFVNVNGIPKENIIQIVVYANSTDTASQQHYTIFFYADANREEVTRGVFGW